MTGPFIISIQDMSYHQHKSGQVTSSAFGTARPYLQHHSGCISSSPFRTHLHHHHSGQALSSTPSRTGHIIIIFDRSYLQHHSGQVVLSPFRTGNISNTIQDSSHHHHMGQALSLTPFRTGCIIII